MALGLLGGLALAFGGKSLLDMQRDKRTEKRNRGMLDALTTLQANPADPMAQIAYRDYVIGQGMPLAQAQANIQTLQPQGGLTVKDQFSMAQDLAKQRTGMLKPYMEQRSAAQKTMTALAQRTGAGDLAAVISFNKSLDPSSAVRESEQKAVTGVAGPIERFRALLQDVEGKGTLTDETRAQLAGLIEEIQANEAVYANNIVQDFENRARGYELDPMSIRGGQLGYSPAGDPLTRFTPLRAPESVLNAQQRARAELRRRGEL